MNLNNILMNEVVEMLTGDSDDSSEDEFSLASTSSSSSSSSSSENDREDHAKIFNFMQTVDQYSDIDFRNHFRLNRSTVKFLLDLYKEDNPPTFTWGGRPKVGPSKEMHLFIWFVSNTETYRQLGDRFGIGRGTCCQVVKKVSSWLVKISSQFIFWPGKEEQSDIKYTFKEVHKMPNALGIIDCSHIKINQPKISPRDYFCYKKHYSIKLQAICDSQMMFRDIYVGEPGSLHDVRVFRRSPFFTQVMGNYKNFFPENSYMLGDSAYQPTAWVVVPYKNVNNISIRKTQFNKLMSSPRVKIEHSFGMVKNRFRRILHFSEIRSLKLMNDIVVSACVLHNICILQNDCWDYTYEIDESDESDEEDVPDFLQGQGVDRRISLIEELVNSGIIN